MNSSSPEVQIIKTFKKKLISDLLLLTIANLLFYLYFAETDLIEWLYNFSREHEQWEIDEFLILGFSLALTLTIFSFRRWHETRQLASQLNSLAIHDKLTGLFNRQMIEQLIQAEQNRLQRSRQPYSLILLDIDHFKRINDLYGHLEGDTLLQQIANLLQKHTRTPDMIGRWGGEEFLILLPETDKRAAHNLAERLRTILAAQAFRCGEQVTASLGIATAVTPECYSTLFLRLDNALYLAKHNGRNRCQMSPESGDDDLLQAVFATKKKPQLKQSGS